jgi:DNA-directed RNA polymerase subunit L
MEREPCRGTKMKVKILKREPQELKIEIEGEGHSFCNALQKVLLEDKTVEMAGYDLPHPLISNPIIYVRTRGRRKPETALREAAQKLQQRNNKFRDVFKRALEAWQKGQGQIKS